MRRMFTVPVARRNLSVFLWGIFLGFLSASLVLLLLPSDGGGRGDGRSRARIAGNNFLPNSPHSHGEHDRMTDAEEQEEAQSWNDFEDESHQSEVHTIASELKKQVRILCWVMTSPLTIQTKARHVNATWGQRCNILVFMSSAADPVLPAVVLDVPEGHDNLWAKTKAAFRYVYENHFKDADWFLKADDDTYAVVENLRYLLKDHDPDDPVYFGRKFRPYVPQGYMSGGAGYVLSREALKRFVSVALLSANLCSQNVAGVEDVEIGLCLQNCGIRAMDSRDKFGRERFHPFPPEFHLIPGAVPKDNWLWEYNYYPIREGPDCCSDFTVTFHYIPPQLMYVFEYLVYHMRPYGLLSNLLLHVPTDDLPEAVSLSHSETLMAPKASPSHLRYANGRNRYISRNVTVIERADGATRKTRFPRQLDSDVVQNTIQKRRQFSNRTKQLRSGLVYMRNRKPEGGKAES